MKKVISLILVAVTLALLYLYLQLDQPYKTITTPFGHIDSSQVETVHIDLDINPIGLDSLLQEVHYIPLEEMEHSKIIRTEMIYMDDSLIIVVDQEGQKVVGFNHEGKYLFDIYKKGRGDRQYKYMEYALYDYIRKEILVVDTWKYIWYDLNGNYIRSYESEYNFNDNIILLRNAQLAYYRDFGNVDRSTNPANLNILNSTGQLISRYIPSKLQSVNNRAILFNGQPLTGQTPDVLITPTYSDKVYKLSNSNKLQLKYNVDFGSYQLPHNYLETVLSNPNLTISTVREFERANNWARLIGSMQTNTTLCLSVLFKGTSYAIYRTKKGHITLHALENKLHGSFLYHVTTYEDHFVSWVNPSDLKVALNHGKIDDPTTIQVVKNLYNGNNPVIRLVKIKDF